MSLTPIFLWSPHTYYHGCMIKMLTYIVFCYWLISFPSLSFYEVRMMTLDFVHCCNFYCSVLCLPPSRWWTNVCWGKEHMLTTTLLGDYLNKWNVQSQRVDIHIKQGEFDIYWDYEHDLQENYKHGSVLCSFLIIF